MEKTNHQTEMSNKGFALLITLLTVAVIVSATIAIVELSRLQLKLAVDSRDAEIAFSAANAAKECGQFVRAFQADTMKGEDSYQSVDFGCFGQEGRSVENVSDIIVRGTGGAVRRYQTEFDWPESTAPRCSVIDIITIYTQADNVTIGQGRGLDSLKTKISNYPTDTKTCVAGSECTIVAAAGYNSSCATKDTPGVIKREILLEF